MIEEGDMSLIKRGVKFGMHLKMEKDQEGEEENKKKTHQKRKIEK